MKKDKAVKLALAMIVKGSEDEYESLRACLEDVMPHVDGAFITITRNEGHDPSKIEELCEFHGAKVSWFDWVNDFAAARNFNFSQVPKEYTHILWADADDTFDGLEKLKPTIEEFPKVDVFSMFYRYAFDNYGNPTVIHQKTQVIKNDGCVEWAGELHEDFKENRSVRRKFIKGIHRNHIKTDDRVLITRKRNIEVARHGLKKKPNDPRSYWNLGNALFGDNQPEEAKEILEKFLQLSSSDEEKYLTHLRLSAIKKSLGDMAGALDDARFAIGTRPEYPDGYFHIASLYDAAGRLKEASEHYLAGLVKKPPYYSIIVYNPRDYDYNPMMALANVFFKMFRPDMALILLEKCQQINKELGITDDFLSPIVKDMKKEVKKFDKVLEHERVMSKIANKDELKKYMDKLPAEVRQFPGIARRYNELFIKKESSGKDLVFYCGPTTHEWNPEMMKKEKVGGSEEAVINLSKGLAERGWNVTVYANTGNNLNKKHGKVVWKPFWLWNHRDKQDVTIFWRSPLPCDYEINSTKIFIDLHDVIRPAEFTPERLSRIDGVFFKTEYHKSLFEGFVPDKKAIVVPNGQDFELFQDNIEKDPHLMVNTSSPDRCMGILPKLFTRVKERVPKAKLVWAYGWDVFDAAHSTDATMMDWKTEVLREMEEAGVENLGKVPQSKAAELYQRANVYAYPTEFPEIDCISIKKAQAVGCVPITTDYAALGERNVHGIKIPTRKEELDSQFDFGVRNQKTQDEWVDAVVAHLQKPIGNRSEMRMWAKQFSWDNIADQWHKVLQ